MNKKILLIILVVVSGLMLGVIFSLSVPSKMAKSGTTSPSIQENPTGVSSIRGDGLQAKLVANPAKIKSVGENVDLKKDFSKIEKAQLTVTYTNNTSSDLTGVQLWISGTGENFGLSSSKTSQYDKDEKIADIKYSIFNAADVKKGQTEVAYIFLYSRKPDTFVVNVEIKDKQGKNAKTNPVNIVAQ